MIELPLHYELEDEPYFAFNLSPAVPPAHHGIASYSHTLGNLQMDFAGFHRFGLCYVLRLHPEIIATPGRIGVSCANCSRASSNTTTCGSPPEPKSLNGEVLN